MMTGDAGVAQLFEAPLPARYPRSVSIVGSILCLTVRITYKAVSKTLIRLYVNLGVIYGARR